MNSFPAIGTFRLGGNSNLESQDGGGERPRTLTHHCAAAPATGHNMSRRRPG